MLSKSCKIRKAYENNMDAGFSLLEMLVALAIMSLTSVALFQSIGTMLNVSDRAVRASERTLESSISRVTMSNLIDGLVGQWSERPEDSFMGSPETFSGLSANAIHSSMNENALFSLSIQNERSTEKVLIYESKSGNWILERGLPNSAHFEYLGRKNIWHNNWPSSQNAILDEQDILSQLSVVKLPLAIRLNASSGVQKTIYVVRQYPSLPNRLEITLE